MRGFVSGGRTHVRKALAVALFDVNIHVEVIMLRTAE
jgi:hypothetical protein